MEENIQFDREKFKDVVHYAIGVAVKNFGSAAIGNTKLHKILYFSDMLKYLESGSPLTGADYQRQRFGPTARHLTSCLKELEREKRVRTEIVNYFGFAKSDYALVSEPRIQRLSEGERSLIEEMASFVCRHTATEISDFSHDDVWSSVPMGERIPYFASFALYPSELTDDDMEEAANESIQLAPKIEVELERYNH